MVTQEQLREHIARKPFRPFRVVLTSGERIDVTRLNQAVAMRRRLVVAPPSESLFRWIWLDQIDSVEPIESGHEMGTGG